MIPQHHVWSGEDLNWSLGDEGSSFQSKYRWVQYDFVSDRFALLE